MSSLIGCAVRRAHCSIKNGFTAAADSVRCVLRLRLQVRLASAVSAHACTTCADLAHTLCQDGNGEISIAELRATMAEVGDG